MYKLAILRKLAKMTKVQPPVFTQLNPVCQISAKNQGIDPTLLQYDPGKATDMLMQRFLQGKIKRYNPEEDQNWQDMIGKSAAALGSSMVDLASIQDSMNDNKQMQILQGAMPQTSTGRWAQKHNANNMRLYSPYAQSEFYNKLTHMTHQSDLMPGVGSKSLSLNTRQNIAKANPSYGLGRGARSY